MSGNTPQWVEDAIQRGDLSPGARTMTIMDILHQYANVNAITDAEARRELRVG
jgi:hypothetical protein